MATLLIGTEVGEGMGHVAPWLDLCAQALQEGHMVHMAGPDMRVLHQRIASRLPVTVWAAPSVQPLQGQPPPKSWPALLVSLGYAHEPWLCGAALAWAAILDAVRPDTVLCDYAPALMLACHVLGVRYLEVGGGFCVPPITQDGAMPPFPGVKQLQRETITSALICLSKALQGAARALRTDRSTAAATTWSELHTLAAHRLVTSPPWLDHYEARDHPIAPVEHLGFLGLRRGQPSGQEADPGQPPTHIVGYLKANTPHLSQLLAHLVGLGMPAQLYCPGQHRLTAPPGFEFSDSPLDLHHVLNPRTLFVTNGGLASVGMALQRRARILLAPQQPEQVAMARTLHKLGLGTVALPESVGAAIDFLCQPRPDRPVGALQTLAAENLIMRSVLGTNAITQ